MDNNTLKCELLGIDVHISFILIFIFFFLLILCLNKDSYLCNVLLNDSIALDRTLFNTKIKHNYITPQLYKPTSLNR